MICGNASGNALTQHAAFGWYPTSSILLLTVGLRVNCTLLRNASIHVLSAQHTHAMKTMQQACNSIFIISHDHEQQSKADLMSKLNGSGGLLCILILEVCPELCTSHWLCSSQVKRKTSLTLL